MQKRQSGFGLIQVAIIMASLAAVAMAFLMSARHERNFFAEGLAKLTGKPAASPMAEIIAEPEGRILADPRASASGKQKGSHIGAAFEKPIPCRFCHPCRVLVMVSFMSCFPLIEKHFLLCHGTRRGVVHIEPET